MDSPAASWTERARRVPRLEGVPLAAWTTLRIGGPAAEFYQPRRPEDLAALLDHLEERELPWRMLGGGANVLAPDGGVRGAVIQTEGLRGVFREGERGLRAWAGASLPGLVHSAAGLGLAGLEPLAGVPGQLGGALAMNAGSAEWGIWSVVREAVLWDPEAAGPGPERIRAVGPEEIGPRYRDGRLGRAVVLEVLLELQPSTPARVRAAVRERIARKNASQPVSLATAGCAFRNPPGDSAGRLLEAAGLKGRRRGRAVFSGLHANFVVNEGGATAAEVRALLEEAREEVEGRFGIRLRPELVIWPEPLPE